MASISRDSGPSPRGSSSSSTTVTRSAASAIRLARAWDTRGASGEVRGFDADRSGRAHDDLLDPKLRLLELGLAMGLQGRAALIDGDRPFQLRLAGLQFGDDPLQFLQRGLEGQPSDVGGVGHTGSKQDGAHPSAGRLSEQTLPPFLAG